MLSNKVGFVLKQEYRWCS